MPGKAAKHRQRLTDGSTKMERHVSGPSICPGTAAGLWSHPAIHFSLSSLSQVAMVVICVLGNLFLCYFFFLSTNMSFPEEEMAQDDNLY